MKLSRGKIGKAINKKKESKVNVKQKRESNNKSNSRNNKKGRHLANKSIRNKKKKRKFLMKGGDAEKIDKITQFFEKLFIEYERMLRETEYKYNTTMGDLTSNEMNTMKKKREERFTKLVQELAEDLDKPDMKIVKEVLVEIYKKNVPIDKRVVPVGEPIPIVLVINYFIDLNFDATAVNRVPIKTQFARAAGVFTAAAAITTAFVLGPAAAALAPAALAATGAAGAATAVAAPAVLTATDGYREGADRSTFARSKDNIERMNSRVERFMKIQRFLKLSQFEDSSGRAIDASSASAKARQRDYAMISIGLINALSSIIPFIRDKMPGSRTRPQTFGGEAYAYRKILYFLKNIDKSIIRDIAKDPTAAPPSIPERAALMKMSRDQLNALARRVGVNTGEAKKKIYIVAAIDRARSNLPPIPKRAELEEMIKSDGEGGEADLLAAENALLALAEAHVEEATIAPADSNKDQKRLLVLAEKNERNKAAAAARADPERVKKALIDAETRVDPVGQAAGAKNKAQLRKELDTTKKQKEQMKKQLASATKERDEARREQRAATTRAEKAESKVQGATPQPSTATAAWGAVADALSSTAESGRRRVVAAGVRAATAPQAVANGVNKRMSEFSEFKREREEKKRRKAEALERLMASAAAAAGKKYHEVRGAADADANHATAAKAAQDEAAKVGNDVKVTFNRDTEKEVQLEWLNRIIEALCGSADGAADADAPAAADAERITALRGQYAIPRAANPLDYSLRAAAINLMGHFDDEFDKAIKEWRESLGNYLSKSVAADKELYDVDKKDPEKNLTERAIFVKDVMNSITPLETEKKDAVVVSPKEPDKARKEFVDAIIETFGKFPLNKGEGQEAERQAKDVVMSIVKKLDIEYEEDIQIMAIELLKKLEPNGLDEYKDVIKEQLNKVNDDDIKKRVSSNICKTLEACDVASRQQTSEFKQEQKNIDKKEKAKNEISKKIKQRNEIKDEINVLEEDINKLEEQQKKAVTDAERTEINKTITEKTGKLKESKANKRNIENKIKKDFETATGMTSEARILEKILKDMQLYDKLRDRVETLINPKEGKESDVDEIMKKILNHMAEFYKQNTGDVDKVQAARATLAVDSKIKVEELKKTMKEQFKLALDNIGGELADEDLFFEKLDGENLEKIKQFIDSAKEYTKNRQEFIKALDDEIAIENKRAEAVAKDKAETAAVGYDETKDKFIETLMSQPEPKKNMKALYGDKPVTIIEQNGDMWKLKFDAEDNKEVIEVGYNKSNNKWLNERAEIEASLIIGQYWSAFDKELKYPGNIFNDVQEYKNALDGYDFNLNKKVKEGRIGDLDLKEWKKKTETQIKIMESFQSVADNADIYREADADKRKKKENEENLFEQYKKAFKTRIEAALEFYETEKKLLGPITSFIQYDNVEKGLDKSVMFEDLSEKISEYEKEKKRLDELGSRTLLANKTGGAGLADEMKAKADADNNEAEEKRKAAEEAKKKAKVSKTASAMADVLEASNDAPDINIYKYYGSLKEIIIEALKPYEEFDLKKFDENKFDEIKKILTAEKFQEIKKAYDEGKNKLEKGDEALLDEIIEKGEEGLKVDIEKSKKKMKEIDKTGALGREMKEQEDKFMQAEAEGVDEVSSTTSEKTGYIELEIKIGSNSEIEEEIKKNPGVLNFLIENLYKLLGVDNERAIIKAVKEEIKDKKNVQEGGAAYEWSIKIRIVKLRNVLLDLNAVKKKISKIDPVKQTEFLKKLEENIKIKYPRYEDLKLASFKIPLDSVITKSEKELISKSSSIELNKLKFDNQRLKNEIDELKGKLNNSNLSPAPELVIVENNEDFRTRYYDDNDYITIELEDGDDDSETTKFNIPKPEKLPRGRYLLLKKPTGKEIEKDLAKKTNDDKIKELEDKLKRAEILANKGFNFCKLVRGETDISDLPIIGKFLTTDPIKLEEMQKAKLARLQRKKEIQNAQIELQEGKNKLKKSIKENKKEEDEAKRKRKMEDEDRKELRRQQLRADRRSDAELAAGIELVENENLDEDEDIKNTKQEIDNKKDKKDKKEEPKV